MKTEYFDNIESELIYDGRQSYDGVYLNGYEMGVKISVNTFRLEVDFLSPHPKCWPERAEWACIDPDGLRYFTTVEPVLDEPEAGWTINLSYALVNRDGEYGTKVELPRGVDWRLCKWSREEARAIWGK